jgi:hypothetical protein
MEPFYGQPTPGEACSGVLVAPDMVITAGHCFSGDPKDCSDRYVIFDYAYATPGQVLEDPPGSGLVPLSPEQVVQCDQVLVDTYLTALTSEEGLLQPPTGGGDWSLWQLVGSAPENHIPIPIDRFSDTQVGDPVLVLHHPARIPMKGELTTIEGGGVHAGIYPLGGTSGSPIIDLATGKLSGVIYGACWYCWGTRDCEEPPCVDLLFEDPPISATANAAPTFAQDVPPIGLQVAEQVPYETVAEFYGPPTTPADYPTWSASLSVRDGSFGDFDDFPLVWEAKEDVPGFPFFEVVSGSTTGTLQDDGVPEVVETAPTSFLIGFPPGVYERPFAYYDYKYGTRTPVTHRAYIGVEGFQKWPSSPLVGEGPGIPHTASQLYTVHNRWIIGQDVIVSATQPWVLVNGHDGLNDPQTFALLPEGTGFPGYALVSFNAANLRPDVHLASLSFLSEDSGTPSYLETLDVRLDVCRRITVDDELPETFNLAPAGDPYEETLAVGGYPETAIYDVDVAVKVKITTATVPSYEVWLKAPAANDFILLKQRDLSIPTVWDDETAPPFDDLSAFDGSSSTGPWILRTVNTGTETLGGKLQRFDVRLHHEDQQSCVF